MNIINRIQKLSDDHSFFLFGARGVGKSSLVENKFDSAISFIINLLDPAEEEIFSRRPEELINIVESLSSTVKYVVIDEVQKVPKLLDVVHLLLETKKSKKIFVLTGSSARKLKVSGVNLLAGRAFVYHLYPFSHSELDEKFDLTHVLEWGMLPKIYALKNNASKKKYLQAYALTYLKEEVWKEHLIKNLDPFRRFLEVAAQSNGTIINYSKIARDVGVEDKTVKNYFSILEDTLLGIILDPFKHSVRKRLIQSPKFYFIDAGIARALSKMLSVKPVESTHYYGNLFEQFIVMECIKLADYYELDYTFTYLKTEAGVEIDLVVVRPGKKLLFIEIKSTKRVVKEQLTAVEKIVNDFEDCEAVCFSRDRYKKKIGLITVYPWKEGIKKYFSSR